MVEKIEIGDWCTLYHTDSVEIVDALRAMNPDAVIMDPPYGIDFVRINRKAGTSVKDGRGDVIRRYPRKVNPADTVVGDDAGVDISPWLSFPQALLWGADHMREQLPQGGRFLAWDKLEGMPPCDGFSDVEFAWHSAAGSTSIISHMWKGFKTRKDGGEHPRAERDHPMQKPIRVMEWCIEQCRLDPGALILDPYMGSGTTAIAAFKRKMRFVGVEIDRRWFDVAVERIARMTADGPLFEVVLTEQAVMAV